MAQVREEARRQVAEARVLPGSVHVTTSAIGVASSAQEFGPWGSMRSGSIGATALSYTGQQLGATGLL